jgi:hypothetical protein
VVTFYEDDNGWQQGHGSTFNLGVGLCDNKGNCGSSGDPLTQDWNDEVRAVSVHMTDSFQSGGKGSVRISGPRTVNIKDFAFDPFFAGKVSSIETY